MLIDALRDFVQQTTIFKHNIINKNTSQIELIKLSQIIYMLNIGILIVGIFYIDDCIASIVRIRC